MGGKKLKYGDANFLLKSVLTAIIITDGGEEEDINVVISEECVEEISDVDIQPNPDSHHWQGGLEICHIKFHLYLIIIIENN